MLRTITDSSFNDSIDFDVIDRVFGDERSFNHRGMNCDQERFKSYLMAAIENADEASPGDAVIDHTTAVDAVISAAMQKYPAWFDQTECNQPTSSRILMKSQIRTRYYDGTLDPGVVNTAEYDDVAGVVDPLIAIMLEDIEEQQTADKKKRRDSAKNKIRRTVCEAAFDADELTEQDIRDAMNSALADLAEQGKLND